MRRLLCLTTVACLALAGCVSPPPAPTGLATRGALVLQELNGETFPAYADILIDADGGVTGQAPCNQYGARQRAKYPALALSPLLRTKRSCEDALAEEAFFAALEAMTAIEARTDALVLSNAAGGRMVFVPASGIARFSLEP